MNRRQLLATILLIAGGAALASSFLTADTGFSVSPVVAVRGVSPDATSDNGQRKLARTGDGTLYLAFSGPVDGVEQAQIYFSLDDGQSWKPETVLGRPGIWSDLPTLAAGPGKRLDAAWVDYISVGHVWHATRDDGSWTQYEKISPGETYAGFPAMAVTGSGANVLWYAAPPDDTREHGSAYEILHTVGVKDGWSTPELLSSNSEDALNPTIAAGPGDVLEAAWFQAFQGTYGAQVAEYDGSSWSFPALISTPAETATGVSIDVDHSGVVNLVWEQTTGDIVRAAYARLDGDAWTDPELLSERFSQDPVVATDARDRVFVIWSEDGELHGRVRSGGWSETVDLGLGTNPSTLSGDRVLAAWTRQTDAGYEVVTSYIDVSAGTGTFAVLLRAAGIAVLLAAAWVVVRSLPGGSVTGDPGDR